MIVDDPHQQTRFHLLVDAVGVAFTAVNTICHSDFVICEFGPCDYAVTQGLLLVILMTTANDNKQGRDKQLFQIRIAKAVGDLGDGR